LAGRGLETLRSASRLGRRYRFHRFELRESSPAPETFSQHVSRDAVMIRNYAPCYNRDLKPETDLLEIALPARSFFR